MSDTRTVISGEELHRAFSDQDWSVLWMKLIGHTIHRMVNRYGRKMTPEDLKAEAEETVSDVINSIFIEGKRKWYPDSKPTLEELMYSSIDSHLYNKYSSSSRESAGQDTHVFERPDPSEMIEERISTQEAKDAILKELTDMGAEDDELLVFGCMLDGVMKPRHIRDELGISEAEFHNIWRRLGRKRDRIADKLNNYGRG